MPSGITGTPFMGGGPEKEGIQTVTVTVQIESYGKPAQVHQEVLKELGRALTNAFGSGHFRMTLGGKRIAYDPLAHDGEHPGHDQILTEEP